MLTNEELIYRARWHVRAMAGLLDEAWNARGPVPLATWNRLEQHTREANSAIIALRQRAAGVPAPRDGE